MAEVRPSYRPDIDGLRAIAILSVVAYHASAGLLPGGFAGVDIFFVISGFLISSLIFKELEEHRFSFADFYIRRIRRIFPALILMLAAVWLAGWCLMVAHEYIQLGRHMVAAGLFASNLAYWREAGYFDTTARLKPLLHLWSLGIEEQYYIVWPVIAVALWKRWLRPAVLLAMALSFAFNVIRVVHHPIGAFYLPFGRAWELLLGSLLAYETIKNGGRLAKLREITFSRRLALKDVASGSALILLAIALFALKADDQFPGWWALLPTIAAFLLIWAGQTAWINRRLLSHPAMVFIGLISYPLYLWHWPLLSFARIVKEGEPSITVRLALVAAAFLLAIATYWFVERPLRRSKSPRILIVSALICGLLAISAIGYLGNLGLLRPQRMAMGFAIEAADTPSRKYQITNCDDVIGKDALSSPYCQIWGDPARRKTFVIWGDSHAYAWTAPIYAVAEKRGARVIEFYHPGCPPVAGVRRSIRGGDGAACSSFALGEDVLKQIRKIAPEEIFVAARWSLYTYGLHANGELIENTFVTTSPTGEASPETSRDALKDNIGKTLDRLAQIGKVVVIKTVPTLKSPIESGIARNPQGFEPTLAGYRQFEALPNAILDEAGRSNHNIAILDPAGILCTSKCHAVMGNVPLYVDDTHLTEQGALLFVPVISNLVP